MVGAGYKRRFWGELMIDTIGAPYKVALLLEKYERHRTPADGEPDEVIASASWHEADGASVTDPARIAELEERAATMAKAANEHRATQDDPNVPPERYESPRTDEQHDWPGGVNPAPAVTNDDAPDQGDKEE